MVASVGVDFCLTESQWVKNKTIISLPPSSKFSNSIGTRNHPRGSVTDSNIQHLITSKKRNCQKILFLQKKKKRRFLQETSAVAYMVCVIRDAIQLELAVTPYICHSTLCHETKRRRTNLAASDDIIEGSHCLFNWCHQIPNVNIQQINIIWSKPKLVTTST